ncbi:hypothetical protein K7B10_15900 [Streptomyces flavotricini]|uniref:Uncharacterized protein n=1 Tax=Streptomyces flavotricini TaxID=66888 RepID=A0ABS8E5S1_9ACTN|nr:hypothetical protein [Streptomyces flavotricini]MCC0096244.1 hypothetical protein [Streptomyces flavotricini]
MAEHLVTHSCEPCSSCQDESWQRIADGRLRWEWQHYCPVSRTQACEGGWGPAPEYVREEIVAREGTVRLEVGGPHGIPLKPLRELMALSLPELVHARTHGFEATPVEAALLRGTLG